MRNDTMRKKLLHRLDVLHSKIAPLEREVLFTKRWIEEIDEFEVKEQNAKAAASEAPPGDAA